MRLPKVKVLINPQSVLSIALQLSIVLLSVAYPLLYPVRANAAVTEGFVRFDRLATGAAITGTACLKSTLTTQTNVVIVFPSGWTISGTASNWTVSTTNLPTDPVGGGAATAWPGINTASSVVGLSVVFPGTALAAGTFYCFNFAGASSTVGTAGNDKTGQLKTQGGSPYTDSIDYSTSVVGTGADQITVTASVSATMTFSLSGNSVALGTLSSSNVTHGSTITETVSTNARNGWNSWVKSQYGYLNSSSASDTISAGSYQTGSGNVVDLNTNTGYVLDVDAGTGTPTVATEYNYSGTVDSTHGGGGKLSTNFQQIATKTTPGSGDTLSLIARAKIASTNKAASDYTDTLTVTAAGSF